MQCEWSIRKSRRRCGHRDYCVFLKRPTQYNVNLSPKKWLCKWKENKKNKQRIALPIMFFFPSVLNIMTISSLSLCTMETHNNEWNLTSSKIFVSLWLYKVSMSQGHNQWDWGLAQRNFRVLPQSRADTKIIPHSQGFSTNVNRVRLYHWIHHTQGYCHIRLTHTTLTINSPKATMAHPL